ncbi:uncharacterized protein LOC142341541 isoform X2 [Convolutriloba macropyga]|uniref:uncharacterized protein LOC142341541 isoform X2 n=1 Tax=Convolutriloba macropyga TaxID=536237 RepID=UPI003F51C15F
MELRNPKQSRRSRLESVSGGNSSHDLAYRIRYNDKSRDGSEKDSNSIGCNLMAMVRLAFSDPVLYRSSTFANDSDFTTSDEYGPSKWGMGARAGVASSYAGIPRRISFRGKRRFKNTSKISLIPSPSSLHNSMANMYPLPSPTGMGSDVQDKRRWSLSFSGRCENFKHNFDVSSNFGTPSIIASSQHELAASLNQSFPQQSNIASLTAQLQQLDFDASIHAFTLGSAASTLTGNNNTLVSSNSTPICSPCLNPSSSSDFKPSSTPPLSSLLGSEPTRSASECSGTSADDASWSSGKPERSTSFASNSNPSSQLTACRSLSYTSGVSSASNSSTDAFNLLTSGANAVTTSSAVPSSAATALHINCSPTLLQITPGDLASLSASLAAASASLTSSIAGGGGAGSSTLSSASGGGSTTSSIISGAGLAVPQLSGLAVCVSPSILQHQYPPSVVNSPMKPRARSLSPTRNTLPLDTSIHLMNDMYRERFPNAISQMEEKLAEFIATNGGVITPSATSTAISTGNALSHHHHHHHNVQHSSSSAASGQNSTVAQHASQPGSTAGSGGTGTTGSNQSSTSVGSGSPSTPSQGRDTSQTSSQSSLQLPVEGVAASPQATPSLKGLNWLSSPVAGGVVSGASTPHTPQESDPVVSFVSHQILKLAKDCLDKSTEKILTGAYFNELCIKVEKLLSDAMDRVENARQLEPVLQRGNKLLSIVSRPARLLECLEFDPEVFYSRLESGQELAPVQWDLAERMNKDLPSYILRLLGEKRDINRLSFYDSTGGYDSGRPNTPDTDESDPVPRALPCEADFEQIKLISNGAYGAVYLVRHKLTKQRFAEKRIKKQDLVLRNMLDQVFAERDILMFAQNPFVVSMFCSFETKKHLCMIMEYVEGGDVGTLLKNVGALPYDLARMYFAETVLAVEYLHSYGIVHRDLKPDNLLITSEGHIKLTDFGLSRMGLMSLACNLYEDLSRPGMFNDGQIIGTPEYIAPECFQKRAYGKPVDWWSCGVILYEFMMGDTPFYGDTPEELFDCALSMPVQWLPPQEVGEDGEIEEEYPPLVAQSLVEDLLVKDPINRRGTGGAVELKNHPFFNELDWNALLKQKAEFIPLLEGDEDTSYFDTRSDRYDHGDISDTDSDEDVCDSSSISLQSQLSTSFSACSPRYQRMCSDFASSSSAASNASSVASASATASSSTGGTASQNNSNCTSPQPLSIQSALHSQQQQQITSSGSAPTTTTSFSAPVSTSPSCSDAIGSSPIIAQLQQQKEQQQSGAKSNQQASASKSSSSVALASAPHRQAVSQPSTPLPSNSTVSPSTVVSNADDGGDNDDDDDTAIELLCECEHSEGMGERQKSAAELNKSFEGSEESNTDSKVSSCQAVKSSSDSKLSKTHHHNIMDAMPTIPSRATKPSKDKPIRYVPEHLQKPIHVDSGVDSSGGCHTPDETPSPVIPPRDFTPKVLSGSNGTGNQSATREPKLPPNVALFSPTTPTKPQSEHPPLTEFEQRANQANSASSSLQREHKSQRLSSTSSESKTPVNKDSKNGSRHGITDLDLDLSLTESVKEPLSSADEQSSVTSSLEVSSSQIDESSPTSSTDSYNNEHTLTSTTGSSLSRNITAELLKLELSGSSIEMEVLEARKKSTASKLTSLDQPPVSSSKKAKSSHSSARKLSSSSKSSLSSKSSDQKSRGTSRYDKTMGGISAKLSAATTGDGVESNAGSPGCVPPSASLLRILMPQVDQSEESKTPSTSRKSTHVSGRSQNGGSEKSHHVSRRHSVSSYPKRWHHGTSSSHSHRTWNANASSHRQNNLAVAAKSGLVTFSRRVARSPDEEPQYFVYDMTTPPGASPSLETRKKSPSPVSNRKNNHQHQHQKQQKLSPTSSDISPDRMSGSGSNSTLKSSQQPPKSTSTTPVEDDNAAIVSGVVTGAKSVHAKEHEDYPRDYSLTGGAHQLTGTAASQSSVSKQKSATGGGVNSGPIFPRIPIKDVLPVIKRGSRGYGFHMKAIKVYSVHSEEYTIQHLVTYVDPSGPAHSSGLKENDLITHIGGQSIQGMAHTEVVYLIIQSRDHLLIQATPLHETSIKNDCARRKGVSSSGSNQSANSFLPGGGGGNRAMQSHIYAASATGGASGSNLGTSAGSGSSSHHQSKNKKSRSSRAHSGRVRTAFAQSSSSSSMKHMDKPQIIQPQRSSRDVIHPTPVGQSHPLSDQPTHVFPSTTSAEQYHHQHHHTQHKSKSHHHSKHKKTAVPATSSDPFNTHAYTQVNSPPLVAPVFTTSSSTTNSVPYSTGTLPKSRSSNLPSSVTSPSGGLPGVAGGCSHSASFAGAVDANQYPIVSGSGCHGSCCKSRSVSQSTGFVSTASQLGSGTTASMAPGTIPPSDHRPQMLNIKLGPKGVASNRRKSGNNMPVSPLARTPSPTRTTKSVNASPSLVTCENVGGSGGVTVMQRKGGGAITCPSRSVNVSPQAHSSAFSQSSPSPSSTSKLVASEGHHSCPISTHASPKLSDQPPPVPARVPVTSTALCSNPVSTSNPLMESFATSSPAVLRTLVVGDKQSHSSQVASSGQAQTQQARPMTGLQPGASPTSVLHAESSGAPSSIATSSRSCPQIGSMSSPFNSQQQATYCHVSQSSSLPNTPNIIKQSDSGTSTTAAAASSAKGAPSPPTTSREQPLKGPATSVPINDRSQQQQRTWCETDSVSGASTSSTDANTVVSITAPKPTLPPRSPSN